MWPQAKPLSLSEPLPPLEEVLVDDIYISLPLDLLRLCEPPCPPLPPPSLHPRKPSRIPSNHPLSGREVLLSRGRLLPQTSLGHPGTTKPQGFLEPGRGSSSPRAEGLGVPLRPSLPPPHFSAGCAEAGEAGPGSVPFWLHVPGSPGPGVVGKGSLWENPKLPLEG